MVTMRKKWRILRALFVCLALFFGGCAAAELPVEQRVLEENEAPRLLAMGIYFANSGQSVRAEQYFLAAQSQGADGSEVFELLIDTTVKSGRLRSALGYAEREIRRRPEVPELRQLAASLYWGLGQKSNAAEEIETLSTMGALPSSSLLFLAEFHNYRSQRPLEAIRFYRSYLESALDAPEKKIARGALLRLQRDQIAKLSPRIEVTHD